jgi:hypothetical protein
MVTTGERLAKQLDVVVARPEGELVERLLDRPHGGGDGAADSSSQGACAIDAEAQGNQL